MGLQILPDKPASIIGRIGKGVARGLSEQVPKEIERYRLSSGLKRFAEQSENPLMKQYAELLSIPGITPQAVQTFGELAKYQANRQAYANRKREKIERPSTQEGKQQIKDIAFAGMEPSRQQPQEPPISPQGTVPNQYVPDQSVGERSGLSPELISRRPWTFDRKMDEMADLYEEFPNLDPQQIEKMASEKEARELAMPEAERKINEEYRAERQATEAEFDRLKQIKLQKKGEETFEDLPGEYDIGLKKAMLRDMRDNNLTREKAADKWSQIALDQAKARSGFKSLANQNIFQNTPSTILDKLKGYQKIFAEGGNLERFYNELQQGKDPKTGRYEGLDLTPQRAAQVSFPPSKGVSEYISKIKRSPSFRKDFESISRKRARELSKVITANDSWLSIAANLKDKDPYFDESSFFRQLREDQEQILMNPRQKRELPKGESGFTTSWGDIWLFPFISEGARPQTGRANQ